VAPPVFKTGLAGIAFAGRFDSFPPPPLRPAINPRRLSRKPATFRLKRATTRWIELTKHRVIPVDNNRLGMAHQMLS
jgi:hypothetical protein